MKTAIPSEPGLEAGTEHEAEGEDRHREARGDEHVGDEMTQEDGAPLHRRHQQPVEVPVLDVEDQSRRPGDAGHAEQDRRSASGTRCSRTR